MITKSVLQTSGDNKAGFPTVEERFAPIREKAKTEGIKVLFFWNSLTYFNDMPQIFRALSLAGGKKVTVDSVTKGGTGIGEWRADSQLWNERVEKIRSAGWDIVVIQPDRHGPSMANELPWYAYWELCAAKELAAIIRKNGSEPVVYSTFDVNSGTTKKAGAAMSVERKQHTDLILAYGAAVAKELDCMAVYAGATFNKVYEDRSDLNLSRRRKSSIGGGKLSRRM